MSPKTDHKAVTLYSVQHIKSVIQFTSMVQLHNLKQDERKKPTQYYITTIKYYIKYNTDTANHKEVLSQRIQAVWQN